ncbi:hypothetical protein LGL55_20455 [Clostridium tagluense]|uniref:MutH/Sau3AI family endonuclease n=1 Tax=Clostridium tagluense TaxID=360422 RepID=UPI001CF2FF11|nr:MutH/Sau3AI family endonuclease [Clostridium tagluense]MCB2313454.1 hypothetical protein [Clostridium tagluense]MCB2318279.1 hypothetical protein [Clostridium tagluense]MCB2323081.1 hypothetical protein [Clostridium tagluense]MCB2328063.1 hypothetical protein [Clostridium tagluense]MCB2332781.1 hypothetical protein [Clostridium tagluense]
MEFKTEKNLLEYTKNIIGKTFKELDTLNLLSKGIKDKGVLGKIVETGFYKYPLNNNAKADFPDLGIELKVTGFVRNKNKTLSAKERLSLSKIDYFEIINEKFEFSKLISKNRKLLVIWYEYKKENSTNYGDFLIHNFQLYNMNIDEDIFRNDFNIIRNKVILGQAHKLSEGDTSYLGAATKGQGSNLVKQPNSIMDAKSRGFSLKNSYMTGILRSLNSEQLKTTKFKTVTEYINTILLPYFSMTQIDIWEKLTGERRSLPVPNQFNKMISNKLLGKDSDLPSKDDLFNKTNYIIKNASFDKNGYPLERLSFRNLTLSEFDLEWEYSEWKTFFEEVTIVVICYEGTNGEKQGFRKLDSIEKITFNANDIDLFEESYNRIRESIQKRDSLLLPRPNSFENQVLEIAPKGGKGANAYNTFFDNDTTKTCFMLSKDFLFSKLHK